MRQSAKSLLSIVLDPADDSIGFDSVYLIFIYSAVSDQHLGPEEGDIKNSYGKQYKQYNVMCLYWVSCCRLPLLCFSIESMKLQQKREMVKNWDLIQQNRPMPSLCQQDSWSKPYLNCQKTNLFISTATTWNVIAPFRIPSVFFHLSVVRFLWQLFVLRRQRWMLWSAAVPLNDDNALNDKWSYYPSLAGSALLNLCCQTRRNGEHTDSI